MTLAYWGECSDPASVTLETPPGTRTTHWTHPFPTQPCTTSTGSHALPISSRPTTTESQPQRTCQHRAHAHTTTHCTYHSAHTHTPKFSLSSCGTASDTSGMWLTQRDSRCGPTKGGLTHRHGGAHWFESSRYLTRLTSHIRCPQRRNPCSRLQHTK